MQPRSQDHTLAARVAARVVDTAGDVVGAGFLVGPDLIATCAHVVAGAIGGDAYAATAPTDPIRLDFPLLAESATAVVHRWLPIENDGTGDVAVLRLLGQTPPGARMPPLRRIDQLWDERFRVLGFPEGLADGVWTTGRIRGEQGTRWFQLQTSVGDQSIVEGFSGAPVWHEETGAVVGMTVAADRSGTTTTAYLIPVEQILGVDPELLPCPYRGLEPFDEEHAEFFFGRDADIALLVDAVARHPLVTVAGPSGAGKSSLVRAGLLPRLRAAGNSVTLLRPVPGQPVEPALRAALEGADANVVLVVDQFEELAATEPQAAQELLERIGELVPQRAKAVITMRSATLDDVLVPHMAGMLGAGTVLVPPMERGQLRDAIVAPAERAPGLSFETGLVDRILDDAAAEPGQLPLVESLLTELWNRRDGGYLTLSAYERAGGVAGVVATHAGSVIAGFTEPDDEEKLRRLFTALAAPDRDGRFIRRPLPWAEIPRDLQPLVQRLAAGRLVVIEHSADAAEHVQLAHQALIAHWPRLRDWLTEDRDFLAWRAQLDQQREQWEATARDDGALLRGSALATAQEWLPTRTSDLSDASQEYVRRSHARQRREVRRWRAVTAVLAVLVLAAGTLSVVAITSRNEVGERLRLANAELVAQASLAREYGDPATATALALAAWRADPQNAAARTAMLRLSMAMRSVDQVFPSVVSQPVATFNASDDGDTLGVREGSGLVVLTGARGATLQRWVLPDMPSGVDRFAMAPNGRFVVGSGSSREIYLWDIANRSGPARVEAASGRVLTGSVSVSPDGARLLWLSPAASGAELVIWDIAGRAVVPHGLGPITDGALSGVTPTLDPQVVIETAASDSGTPNRRIARSLVDGTAVATLPTDSVLMGNGAIVSCASDTPTQAVVWSTTGAELRRLGLLTDKCTREYLNDRLTADDRYLMESRASTRDRDSDAYRITALSDGRTFDLTAPPSSAGPPGLQPMSSRTVVVPAAGDRVDVFLPAASSILRLHAVADVGGSLPAAPWAVGLSSDQRYEVTISADLYTVLEPGTRTVVGRLERSRLPDQGEQLELVGPDSLTIRTKAADHWSYSEYALPSLALTHRYEFPRAARRTDLANKVAIDTTADRVAAMADSFVAVWDRHDGRMVGKPIALGTNSERFSYFDTTPRVALRPGPAGKVVVVGPDGVVELWDPATSAQEGVIALPNTSAPTEIAVDQTGTRLAVVGLDFSVQIWDLERRVALSEPFLLPSIGLLRGFTADGNIAILLESGDSGYQLSIWDPRSRREVGSLRLSPAHDVGYSRTTDGKQLMIYGLNGALPVVLPMTAQGWSEQLCRIGNRPFTDAERALVPEGTDVDQPCA